MKIIIGGGGTGGHIYPALALARYTRSQDRDSEILFVGSKNGLENKIIPSSGFRLVTIHARGFQRSLKQIGAVAGDLISGFREAGRIIDCFRPDVVLGTGGYVAAPLLMAALTKKYPTVIHEQNALPGLTNRQLSRYVSRVCISFAETGRRLPRSSRIVLTGNPRASEVGVISREEGCGRFGFDPAAKTLLIFGGSRGALKLNREVAAYLKDGFLPESINMIYITGEIYYREVLAEVGSLPERVKLLPYLEEMPAALAAADLAVTRSGATTLAEITAIGLPAILIPSPNVVNNHQYYNARVLADAGAAVLIEEKDFNCLSLKSEIDRLFGDPETLAGMGRHSRKLGLTDAAARLYE
ncbi:MAG TPA: undecaprenyldiphospho-muramoylpentapeptide beta-N-acetylglucosaminyltransferase, partial [Firmicutes bacterium]|nr:undecaprenyldiphospho-muramoylpentapeptide beta-N-acetylglucosaminyltransferase [Bacillota bacterium]